MYSDQEVYLETKNMTKSAANIGCSALLHLSLIFSISFISPVNTFASTGESTGIDLAQLLDGPGGQGTNDRPDEYFTINEGNRIGMGFSAPLSLVSEVSTAAKRFAASLPLTQWLLHNQAPQLPTEKYNRKYHFGSWVNDPNDQSCYNTRAKVLIRDSVRPVQFKPNNRCVVESGLWNDPYTGTQFISAKDIQIDHVVPLKHAYTTGAFRWNYQTRCHYGNFIEANYHLLSVNGHENMKKGDKSPDEYMPPNPRAACGYLQAWLEIKLAWRLVIFPNEAAAIRSYIQRFRCNPNQFVMNQSELIRQRQAMSQNLESCQNVPNIRPADSDSEE